MNMENHGFYKSLTALEFFGNFSFSLIKTLRIAMCRMFYCEVLQAGNEC